MGWEWGGLIGGVAGSFAQGTIAATKNAVQRPMLSGLIGVGPDLLGGGAGAYIGFNASGGDLNCAFHGATMGMMAANLSGAALRGLWGVRRATATATARTSGRYTFDFEAMRFRDAQGTFVPFEQVQAKTFASMERARGRLNFPEGEHTLARLDAGGRSHLGRNSGAVPDGTNVTLKPLNAQTRTHAEGEVFQRFFDKAGTATEGVLWVDRGFCGSCGPKGGVGSLLRATGMKRVIAITPEGTFIITAGRPSGPVPITIM